MIRGAKPDIERHRVELRELITRLAELTSPSRAANVVRDQVEATTRVRLVSPKRMRQLLQKARERAVRAAVAAVYEHHAKGDNR